MALTPTAPRFHLELDGVPCGFLRAAEGGAVSAEVVRDSSGPGHFLKKQLGRVAVEPIVLTLGLTLEPVVYEWIADTWNGKASSRSGAIGFADTQLRLRKLLAFENAVISSVTIPAHDGSSRDPCFLTVTIQPEAVERRDASGSLTRPAQRSKQWLASNFQVEIGGLDTSRVARIAAFTVETRPQDVVGKERLPSSELRIDFPDLRIGLPEPDAVTWLAWYEEFVIRGQCDDTQEKTGSLVVLGPSLKGQLMRVDFEGLGIYRIAAQKPGAGEGVSHVEAELYCERMSFSV